MIELDGKKLTYEELVELLCLMNVRLERIEKYVTWLNKEIANWAEFQTSEILKTECDMKRYKVPFKRFDELEQTLKNYIAFNENKKQKKDNKYTGGIQL
jgi:hypothetical protein